RQPRRRVPHRVVIGDEQQSPAALDPLFHRRAFRIRKRRFLRRHRRPARIGNHQKDRKSTRLNSSHVSISYAVFCLKKKIPTTLPTAYDVYPLDGRHDGGYYTVKDCVTIDVLPRTSGNYVYVGFMAWSNFTATNSRGLVWPNQVIKEIICLQPLK